MAAPMFIFGGDTGVASPKELKRLRSIAEALSGRTRAPQNIGEGLSAIGDALLYRSVEGKADRLEREGEERAKATMNPILEALGGGVSPSINPSSGKVGAALIGKPGAASELAATSPADVSDNGSTFAPFIDTVKAGGLTNPYGLAAVAATGRAESGWSPKKAGGSWADPSESGEQGTSGGVMSWRAERLQNLRDYAASKGEGGNGSPQTQAEFFMKEDPQLIAKLNSAKSPEEAANLMANAWRFAGYNRQGGEAARRQSYASAYLPTFTGQGQEVASLDPSVGMPPAAAAIERQAPASGYVDPRVSAPNYNPTAPNPAALPAGGMAVSGPQPRPPLAMGVGSPQASLPPQQPGNALPPLPSRDVGPAPPVAAVPQQQAGAPQQVAQAQQSGPTMQQLYQALQNPWLNEGQQRIILGEIQRREQQNDPVRQMQLRKGQLELEAAERGTWARLDDGRLYNQRTGEVKDAPVSPNAPASDLGLNPQYGVDEQGNPVLLQLGKNGKVVQSQLPPNVKLSKEPIKLDAGTHFVLLDPITRQPVGTIPKDNRGVAEATAGGKADAEAKAALPQVEAAGNQMLSSIESLINDPYLDNMVGSVQGKWLPNVTSDAARVQSKMDQIGGQSFLQAFNSLRGGGQITEQEGAKATAAMGRLNTAQNESDYREALNELRTVVQSALERARARVGGQAPATSSPAAAAPRGPVSIGGYTIEAE